MKSFFLTFPHSGEEIPNDAAWFKSLSREVQLTDVDRFVDQLYRDAILKFKIPFVKASINRSIVDLNRYPDDIDSDSVKGSKTPSGTHTRGFHWVKSTKNDLLMKEPISFELHQKLTKEFHDSFHEKIERVVGELQKGKSKEIFHLDCHSMPSQGTGAHADSGKKRVDVVVSDFEGTSSKKEFVDLVISAFKKQGLSVAYNDPYKGGRITQRYGKPKENFHTVQIELNRALYMNETTREKNEGFKPLAEKLISIIGEILK